MDRKKSKLILKTFDGTMNQLHITPACTNSKVEFQIKYYNDEDILTEATMVFDQVIAIDFEVNYFDNYTNIELKGFYEIFDIETKIKMIEKIFINRLQGYIYHGDYNYDVNRDDMLNDTTEFNKILKKINTYCLYQLQTEGGIFYILSKNYQLSRLQA